MCPWVGPHAPSFGGQLWGLPSRVEYLSPQGVLLPLVYGTTASPLWPELRGHSAWQATPSWTVYRLACHWLLPWLRVTFAMVPDAAWPGSDQWPWSTAPATGPVGRLGRPSASDPSGVGSFLSLRLPYQEARTESQVRLCVILVFRFFALFCGIDLERTKRTDIIIHDKVWFVMSRRKGRPVHEPCPIHAMSNGAFCPIYWLRVYLDMITSYGGPALFVSLKPSRRPILASTIHSLTRTFLRSMGLHEFTAHSTNRFSSYSAHFIGS